MISEGPILGLSVLFSVLYLYGDLIPIFIERRFFSGELLTEKNIFYFYRMLNLRVESKVIYSYKNRTIIIDNLKLRLGEVRLQFNKEEVIVFNNKGEIIKILLPPSRKNKF